MINENSSPYDYFKEDLNNNPFILIVGKYDQILGPITLFSSVPVEITEFTKHLIRDALAIKNKSVILDFNNFYAQVHKIEVEDESARGKSQLYSIILLRHIEYPLIPIPYLDRIEKSFREIGNEKILLNDINIFKRFFEEVSDKYLKLNVILPSELRNLQIRSEINTIQGFCELFLEKKSKNEPISEDLIYDFIEMTWDSCNEIIKALESKTQSSLE